MLAPRDYPAEYRAWNKKNGAPFGYTIQGLARDRSRLSIERIAALRGPFSLRGNNTTREFEYPWAFHVAGLRPGMKIIEIGGGVSGFQFAVSRHGCHMINIDPGFTSQGSQWTCSKQSIGRLNAIFGTNVILLTTTIKDANLPESNFDRVFAISVIEHLPEADARSVIQHVHRVLRPDGLFVVTVDLFLDLQPFTGREQNRFGTNQNLKILCEAESWEIMIGNPAELFGYSQFDAKSIKRNLDHYLLGECYPVLVQCLVLKRRGPPLSPSNQTPSK